MRKAGSAFRICHSRLAAFRAAAQPPLTRSCFATADWAAVSCWGAASCRQPEGRTMMMTNQGPNQSAEQLLAPLTQASAPSSDPVETLAEHKTVRRGLLAVLGGLGAAA